MLQRHGVDFLAVFAPGVPRNMVRSRIDQIFGRRSYGSSGCGYRCISGICALSWMCYEDTDTGQFGLVGHMKLVDSVLACGQCVSLWIVCQPVDSVLDFQDMSLGRQLNRCDIFMLQRHGVDFLAVFAPGVPRNMVRSRINQIFGRRSYESSGCGYRCISWICALSLMCYEDTDTSSSI